VENGRRRNAGELRLASTGALLARAHGVFVERDASHFERYRRWIADQDAEAPASGAALHERYVDVAPALKASAD
jgi:hypothetical protein